MAPTEITVQVQAWTPKWKLPVLFVACGLNVVSRGWIDFREAAVRLVMAFSYVRVEKGPWQRCTYKTYGENDAPCD